MRAALIALTLLLLAGCATRHAPPTLAAAPARSPEESWALVLDRHVDADGRIDFAGVADDPEPLEHYVAHIAETVPAPNDVAFHVNAYNALAMYNVISSGKLPEDVVGFFVLQAYRVDGAYRNLYDYENRVIRPLGEPRSHFALNCMVRSCPRLLRQPYRPDVLDAQLEAATSEFLRDDRNVQVDHERRVVKLSMILEWYRKDFGGRDDALIAYVNGYREPPIPTDYRVRFLPWDWTLNTAQR